jgi:hypothetical protein
MSAHMAVAVRAVHQLDLQTHAYQEDQDPQRIAVARTLAARLFLAIDREARARGIEADEIEQARNMAKRRRAS